MSQYIIICHDKPGSLDLRMATRAKHLEWVKAAPVSIALVGPLLEDDEETFAGSVFVVEADSKADVIAWQATDPYVVAGLFARVEIRAFKWLMGTGPKQG